VSAGDAEWRALRKENTALLEALEAVLMFHAGGQWDADKRNRWQVLTGHEEATTKVLCDFVRAALTGAPREEP